MPANDSLKAMEHGSKSQTFVLVYCYVESLTILQLFSLLWLSQSSSVDLRYLFTWSNFVTLLFIRLFITRWWKFTTHILLSFITSRRTGDNNFHLNRRKSVKITFTDGTRQWNVVPLLPGHMDTPPQYIHFLHMIARKDCYMLYATTLQYSIGKMPHLFTSCWNQASSAACCSAWSIVFSITAHTL